MVAPEELLDHVKGWIRLWITIPNAVLARHRRPRPESGDFNDDLATFGPQPPVARLAPFLGPAPAPLPAPLSG